MKRDLAELLDQAKTLWEARKKRRLEEPRPDTVEPESTLSSTMPVPDIDAARPSPTLRIAYPDPDSFISDPTIHEPIAHRRPSRTIRLPPRYREDVLPEPTRPIQPTSVETRIVVNETLGIVPIPARRELQTFVSCGVDAFGITRKYTLPSGFLLTHDPDQALTLKDLTDSNTPEPRKEIAKNVSKGYGPFASKTAFSLADWYWASPNKSLQDFQKLIQVMKDPKFSVKDATEVNWGSVFKTLGANREDLDDVDGSWIEDDGWKSVPISIDIPFHQRMASSGTESYLVGNLRCRNILSVIKEKLSNPAEAREFHYYPYNATWKPHEGRHEVSLHGELYMSQEFRDAHDALQETPSTATDCNLERVVVALMFWSDATSLTSFGPAKLWPCYMYFGNESKYRRCRPTENLCYQVAYFESISDTIKDYLKERNGGKLPTDALLTHCVREVFHEQWSVLLDEELVDAMIHGIVITCIDGKQRRFFPRIFTYSADYPEKSLIATIRNNGLCPCHRCLVQKSEIHRLGAPNDVARTEKLRDEQKRNELVVLARQDIFEGGFSVDGTRIETKLKPESLVPVQNVFSTRLSSMDFSIFPALVVDLMHEFEIGVWKRLFIHLIRLLEAQGRIDKQTLTAELDFRYRATPTFGRDGIRKFGTNASEMKRKAARDFEDLLQCAIPAFDSLLPEPHNTNLLNLLYICAQWHSLAKLRLHSDQTLDLMQYSTTLLGAKMRVFDRDTCSQFHTRELAKEAEVRARRESNGKSTKSATPKPASLNIYTIKFHYLGDYVSTIRRFGTCDSYSTELGELAHRLPKSWYGRTDKKDYHKQMAQIERRRARLARIRATSIDENVTAAPQSKDGAVVPPEHVPSDPSHRYNIGVNQNQPIDLNTAFLPRPGSRPDPYVTDFIAKLKQHILPRFFHLLGFGRGAMAQSDWTSIVFQDGRLYQHKVMRINYTTYDVRRDEDVVHIHSPQRNLMMLNDHYTGETQRTEHPYLYAQVLMIFHANVSFLGTLPDGTRNYTPRRMDFVWVRWYDLAPGGDLLLDQLRLRPIDDSSTFGFIDPADVIRAAHLIPQFSRGKSEELISHWIGKGQDLWKSYYVNRFTDRDMFMRYQWGMSVGHTYMHHPTFSAPVVPSIPLDFDFGTLANEEPVALQTQAELEAEQPPFNRDSDNLAVGLASSTQGDPAGLNHADYAEDEDVEAPEGDVMDDLDDNEFSVFDEMFGVA